MITAARLEGLLYDLPLLVTATRRRRGQNIRTAAEQIGIASSTVHRIEHGYNVDVVTLIQVLRWIEDE